MKSVILSSTADYGTRSILSAYETAIQPAAVMEVPKGLKKLNLLEIFQIFHFIFVNWLQGNTIVCLHNAPILLCGIFPLPRRGRWVGIIDWNELLCRSGQKIPFFAFYDLLYRIAFHRMSGVYSPSVDFIELYKTKGIRIQQCEYPLPKEPSSSLRNDVSDPLRVLFVGADYKRKGGDILLEAWKATPPSGAILTFVCPHPPEVEIKGVSFLRNVRAGTPEQQSLFQDHDIFILPTRIDAFGFALLEALNSGMFVITTSGAGAGGVVARFGGIVARDPEAAITSLMEMLGSAEEVNKRKEKCQAYIPEYRCLVKTSLIGILGEK